MLQRHIFCLVREASVILSGGHWTHCLPAGAPAWHTTAQELPGDTEQTPHAFSGVRPHSGAHLVHEWALAFEA